MYHEKFITVRQVCDEWGCVDQLRVETQTATAVTFEPGSDPTR
jgi:hypothetical protein